MQHPALDDTEDQQYNKDEARARKALDVLKNEVPKSEFMTNMIGGEGVWDEYVKKAELGDPSGFQYDIEVNPIIPLKRAGK